MRPVSATTAPPTTTKEWSALGLHYVPASGKSLEPVKVDVLLATSRSTVIWRTAFPHPMSWHQFYDTATSPGGVPAWEPPPAAHHDAATFVRQQFNHIQHTVHKLTLPTVRMLLQKTEAAEHLADPHLSALISGDHFAPSIDMYSYAVAVDWSAAVARCPRVTALW